MAESGEGEEIAPRGNDWEVVSLTASAYAAAPGPKAVEETVGGDKGGTYEEDKVETSQAMFVSGHFVFPSKQPENVPVGPAIENSQVPKEPKVEELAPLQSSDVIAGFADKDEAVKGLSITDDDLEARVFQGRESATETVSAEVQISTVQPAVNLQEVEQSILHSAEQASAGAASPSDAKTMISDLSGPSVEATADGPEDVTSSEQGKDKKKARSGVHCAPWWKRQAASLYDHVKEANPLWSIVIAAAVMGLAVLGQRWHQRKAHVSPLNLQFSAKEETPGKMLSPITRLKEALVSGNPGSGSVRNHVSSEI